MKTQHFSIAMVESDTGLSKDVLRVWERRYGFPAPARDDNDERIYPHEQVVQLRLIKRLMDSGYRPGKLLEKPVAELQQLGGEHQAAQARRQLQSTDAFSTLLALLKAHDVDGFLQAMQQRLAAQGLKRFVTDTVATLTSRVGEAWETGYLEVFEEHLYSELVRRMLQQSTFMLPQPAGGPRVLLTTAPHETHMLGIMMVETLLALEGAKCFAFGTDMPLTDIARGAGAFRADIVALSFSLCFKTSQIPALVGQLRALLPQGVEIWAGGRGIGRPHQIAGVRWMKDLGSIPTALKEWRGAHPA